MSVQKRRTSRRKQKNTPYIVIALLIVAVIIVAFIPLESDSGLNRREAESEVSSADLEKVVLPANVNNSVINYEGFTVGFNPEMHQPNYVVWTLDPSETDGDFSRNDVQFLPDDRVPGCATLADYRGSGFDRGHMAPAADMKWSERSMADCHLLTNMCPQDKRLNSGAWATVEKNARNWAKRFGPLVIVAGPVLSDRLTRSIGTTPVPVPERFFKVILAPEANPPMGIAFLMPNSYVEGGAQASVVSIDDVEAVTGFDFFSELPDDIENEVERQNKFRMWNR